MLTNIFRIKCSKHPIRIVTTSWDDGHPHDLKLAELIVKYGIRGTFYIPIKNSKREVMNHSSITEIAEAFEIGGHTYNHVDLTQLTFSQAKDEIYASKTELSNIVGSGILTFCYPRGKHNKIIRELICSAGYIGGRTTRWFSTEFPQDAFLLLTSVQACPHNYHGHIKSCLAARTLRGLQTRLIGLKGGKDWVKTAEMLFDYVIKNGGVWHLWGHSWELEELNLWSKLEKVLQYISGCSEVIYCTNAELIQLTTESE